MTGSPPTSSRPRDEAAPSGPVVIGLAGGIGAGKSHVAKVLGDLGCVVSDSDALAKAALQEPGVRGELAAWWGPGVLDDQGRVDRARVGAIVFADPAQRRRLEALVHPRVHAARARQMQEARARGAPALVIDAPLLFEAGVDAECDAVVFVECPAPVRRERVRARGWTDDELARREAAQLPLEEKRRRCRFVIDNDPARTDLPAQARRVLDEVLNEARRRSGTGEGESERD